VYPAIVGAVTDTSVAFDAALTATSYSSPPARRNTA
jgi:hypothetical protein